MYKSQVGQLLKEGITHYPEGVKFDFQQYGPTLLIFFNKPSIHEIKQIKKGNFKLGIWEKDNIIFILAKFGGMNWLDAPYSVHLSKPFTLETPREGQGYALNIYLIDALDGTIKAMRLVGLEHNLSLKLKSAIEKQKEVAFSIEKYSVDIRRIYNNFTTEEMVIRGQVE